MPIQLNAICAVGLVAFYSLGSLQCRAQSNPMMRAAALLFQQFETVAYTNREIPAGVEAPNGDEGVLRYPFIELLAGFKTLEPKALDDLERSYSPILGGAKDFIGPQGLGPVSSHHCYIGMLSASKQPDLATDFRKARAGSIGGHQVWTWEMPPYEGHPQPTTFYFSQIADSYFVMANDRQAFQGVLGELALAKNSETLPVAVPGWNTFSTYKYWVYRSIRRTGVTDPAASGLTTLPSSVIALAFFADVDANQSYFQVYSSDKTAKAAPKDLPVSGLVQYQPKAPGVWQATVPLLTKKGGTSSVLFQVFFYLGFGVAL